MLEKAKEQGMTKKFHWRDGGLFFFPLSLLLTYSCLTQASHFYSNVNWDYQSEIKKRFGIDFVGSYFEPGEGKGWQHDCI
jgi:hypothetical protein